MSKRGRPVGSRVRDNIIDILYVYGPLHGYRIHSIYNELFPEVSRRLVYYHLEKGEELGVIVLESSAVVEGEYSWGSKVRRKQYAVGPNAEPKMQDRIKKHKDEHHSSF